MFSKLLAAIGYKALEKALSTLYKLFSDALDRVVRDKNQKKAEDKLKETIDKKAPVDERTKAEDDYLNS
jgi:DNA replication protein DnaC